MRLLVVVMATLLNGCVFSEFVSVNTGIACASSANCPDGYRCHALQDICIAGEVALACTVDRECPFGHICVEGSCDAGCIEDGDCGLNHVCYGGLCAEDSSVCNDLSTCSLGETCISGHCEVPAGFDIACEGCRSDQPCYGNSDCPSTQECVGFKVERNGPDALLTFGRCACRGGECEFEEVVDDGSCSSDSQCGSGYTCHRSPCFEGTMCGSDRCGGGRVLPSFSASGFSWPPVRRCPVGSCVKTSCTSSTQCITDIDCPRGYSCFSIVDAETCTAATQCATGQACQAFNEVGQLGCTCSDNDDCSEARTCTNGFCTKLRARQCRPAFGLSCEEIR